MTTAAEIITLRSGDATSGKIHITGLIRCKNLIAPKFQVVTELNGYPTDAFKFSVSMWAPNVTKAGMDVASRSQSRIAKPQTLSFFLFLLRFGSIRKRKKLSHTRSTHDPHRNVWIRPGLTPFHFTFYAHWILECGPITSHSFVDKLLIS